MSIDNLFKDAQIEANKGNIYNALLLLKNIWLKFPHNKRVFEEVIKLKNKNLIVLQTSLNQTLIDKYFKLHNEGKTEFVIEDLNKFYNKNKNDLYAVNLLGTFNGLINKFDLAIKFQQKSLYLNFFDQSNYLNLALTFIKCGHSEKALELLEIGRLINKKNTSINLELARLYSLLNKFSLSINVYENLLENNSDKLNINLEYIRTLIKGGESEKALTIIEKLQKNSLPNYKLSNLESLAHYYLNNFKMAQKCVDKALYLNEKNSDSYNIQGSIFEQSGQIDLAILNYKKSTYYNNKNYVAFNNLGVCLSYINEFELSVLNLKKAIEIKKSYFEASYRLGQIQIYTKNFSEGWKNFKYRWKTKDYNHKFLKTSKPILTNFKSKNRNILYWSEQGLGDQVMYGSMFNELSQLSSKVIIKLDERLIKVFKKKHPKIQFYANSDLINEDLYDEHIPFGDIGNYLRLKKEDFLKPNFPYINGKNSTKDFIIKKYKSSNISLVGISWSSANYLLEKNKSLSLEQLYPILSNKNAVFISLEYKDHSKEMDEFFQKYKIKIFKEPSIDNFKDIEGLSSIIEACDYVITCSNTNAHLCGALNKKTYLLLAKGKGRLWNWSSNNGLSIWYPKIRIYQQEKIGDWTSPINRIKKEILNEKKIT